MQGLKMNDIVCGRSYAGQILAIFNEAIANSTALWDYEPRTIASMEAWFNAKDNGGFQVIGMVDQADNLLAFGSYGPFRAWPAYKYSVELSVYVEKHSRRHGLGRRVLKRLIAEAESQGYHTLIGGIESTNTASIELCISLGFEKCAEIRHAGFKFGRWLDLLFYQMLLNGPATPKEGNTR
jgi:L-amino acid N-acyltransferase YncA